MILVDTSALIALLRGDVDPSADYLRLVIEQDIPFALTPIVVQETLQGAQDAREWKRLRGYLSTQPSLEPENLLECHLRAAEIFFDCRRRGLTIRNTIDCLIAQIAIEHGVPLLQNDRDFAAIARVRRLRLLP